MPAKINVDFLRIAGIGEAVIGRVTEALEFLQLTEDEGVPTERLRAMAGAPDPSYRELLSKCVRDAYAKDFETVNPGEDSQRQIVEAFRRYEPKSQTPRMVMLFLGLCREAGIPVLDAPRERGMQGAARRPVRGPKPPILRVRPRVRARVEAKGNGAVARPWDIPEDDISKLSKEEFDEVWSSLGKVAWTMARARSRPNAAQESGGAGAEEVAPE